MKKRLFATVLALCLLLGLLPGGAWAAEKPEISGTCGDSTHDGKNVQWFFVESEQTLTLTGSGETASAFGGSWFAPPAPWRDLADKIKHIHVQGKITKLGRGIFSDCTSAVGITLPETLEAIGEGAFPYGGNAALQHFIIGSNKGKYFDDSGVLYERNRDGSCNLYCYPSAMKQRTYELRSDTQKITGFGFWDNKYIEKIVLNDSLSDIRSDAFSGCTALTEINIPSGITSIQAGTFEFCYSLKNLTLPSSLTSLDISAFFGCDAIDSFTIPASVTEIKCEKMFEFNDDYSRHKDFYFRGNAPKVDDNMNWSSLHTDAGYICSNVYYPENAQGWTELAERFKNRKDVKFYPYDLLADVLPAAPAISLTTSTTIPAGTSTAVQWNAVPGAARYLLSVMTRGTYLDKDTPISECKKELQFLTPGVYEIWVKAENAKGTSAESNRIVVTVTEKPIEPVKYTVSYDLNGGTMTVPPAPTAFAVGETVAVSMAVPARNGYTFLAWRDGNALYGAGQQFDMPARDVVLKADWVEVQQPAGSYSVIKALQYAQKNWSSGIGACADFVSRCVRAGGININVEAGTGGCWQAICNATGLQMQDLKIRSNGYVYKDDNEKILTAGDVVVQWCYDCSISPHVLICGGYNKSGGATFYAHNKRKNNEVYVFNPHNAHRNHNVGAKVIRLSTLSQDSKKLSYSQFTSDCPVDLAVTVNGEMLDSRAVASGTISNNYATMVASGAGQDRQVIVTVKGEYIENHCAQVSFYGIDNGQMTLTVNHFFNDNTSDNYTFQNVPLTNKTVGSIDSMQPHLLTRLIMDEVLDNSQSRSVWVALPNETVTSPILNYDPEYDPNYDPTYDPSTGDGAQSIVPNTNYISVPKTANGEIIPSTRYAAPGERVTLSIHPNDGFELASLTVTDVRGRTLTLRDLGDNRRAFTMPDNRVTVDAVFQAVDAPSTNPADDEPFTGLGTPGITGIVLNPAPMPFTDVQPKDWFYDNVDYMWKHYLMSGVTDTQFSPNVTTSRAMIWTILARMNKIKANGSGNLWYEPGMLWAMEQGVTDGTSPLGDITREQLATMLWRNAGKPTPGAAADLSRFSDSSSVSDYAQTAVRWAASVGILQGNDGRIDPLGTATRAQVAAMVARYGDRIA
ncbi:MAG: leucine-rich repeat protein [Lachnospiraceae bacterium]|nr:leucine-rich repeat protein [Lachnospiraceae bacterium]